MSARPMHRSLTGVFGISSGLLDGILELEERLEERARRRSQVPPTPVPPPPDDEAEPATVDQGREHRPSTPA